MKPELKGKQGSTLRSVRGVFVVMHSPWAHAQAFTGGLSSFTLFNMVAGYLKHLAAAGELSDLARPLPRAADAAAPSTLPPATVLLPPPIMTCRSKLRLPWEQSLAAAVMWQDAIPGALPPYIRAATFRPSRVPTAAMRGARKQPRWPAWPLDPDADARVVGDAPLGPAPAYEPEDAPEDTVEHDLGPCLVPFVSEGEDSARLVDDVRAQAALQRERLVREADLGNLLLKILQVRMDESLCSTDIMVIGCLFRPRAHGSVAGQRTRHAKRLRHAGAGDAAAPCCPSVHSCPGRRQQGWLRGAAPRAALWARLGAAP